jgi:hypothetical protein
MITEKNQKKSIAIKSMERKKSTVNTKKIMENTDTMTMGIKMNIRVVRFTTELLKKYLVMDYSEKLLSGQKIRYQNLFVLLAGIL